MDVAVVYNDKNSLHSTNSGKVGEKAIAFGRNTIADGKFSVAIGDGANVDANGVYESSGNYSTAVGAASGAWGTQSTAVGYNAKTQGQNAVALGFSASASGKDTVAIGANSVANREAGAVGLYAPTGNSSSTWKATSGAVSIGSSTKTRQIINLAAGTADTDAVNVAQLKKVKAEADKHTTLVAGANVTLDKKETENGLQYTINAIGGSNYQAGKGIAIEAENNTISVKLQADSNLVVDSNGLALKKQLTGMESIQGAGEGKISFDGANVKVNNTTFGENSVVVGGGTDGKTPVTINGTDGVVSGLHNTNIGYTDFATKGNAATEEQLKKVMDAGWKFTTDSNQETTVKVGPDGTNANAVTFKGDSANVEVTNTGNNIKVALKNDLTVDSVKAGSSFMSATGIGYGDKAYITSSGLNANGQTITNVKAGEAETDAVNVGQLNAVKAEASKKTTLSNGKNTTVTSVTTDGQTDYKVNVAGDLKDITSVANGASKIKLNADSIIIANTNKTFAITNSGIGMSYVASDYSTKAIMLGENGTTISGGLNVAGSKISGVADGTIAAGSTDAVNGSQLYDVKNSINTDISNKTFGLKDEKGNEVTNTLGNTVQVKGADGITSTVKDGALEIGLKLQEGSNLVVNSNGLALNTALTGIQSINGTGAGSISFNGGNVKVNQNTFNSDGRIQNVANGTETKDAVNFGQLDATNKKVDNLTNEIGKGWTVATENGTATKVGAGDTVKFSGDDNIKVSNTGKDVKVELNKKLTVDSVKAGDFFMDKNEGVGYKGKAYITSSGLNANGQTITNVKAGEAETDAVNVSQLNKVSEIANKGWKLKTNNGNVSDVKPGDEVEFDGDDNIKVSNAGNKVSFKLNNKLTGIESITGVGGGSISFSGGNVTINNNVTFGSNGQIHNVTAGTASTDAVNVGQLNAAVQAGNTDTHIKPGEYGVGADNKVNMDVVDKTGTKINTVTITDVAKASDLGNVNNINNDLKNSNGTTTVVDAVNNLNQKLDNKVGDLQYSKVDKGDIADGDSTTTAIGKLDQKLNDVAATAAKQHTTVSGSGNIVVEDPTINADGGKNYNVKLADDINVNSVTANTFKADKTIMDKDGLKVGEKVSVTENAVTAGKTSISDEGVKVGDKTYISDKGLNANGQNITNVADGKVEKDSKDAINGGQLFDTETKINNRIDGVENQVISNSNRIGQLSSRVNKVGAGAAALAALHPMDFDPDDKLTFSAGYGNYAGQNAAAIGAYYRPDEKVMFSVGGTVGNGENMVNAGISFSLDRTNHVSNSRTALAREVIDLRGQLAEMGAKMAKMEKAFGMLDESKTKLFPDIPANHWAYEYIAKLAGNGILEGYPDGNFGGDRLMTRYEFATMLYRAIENGAALEERIIKEFEPELGRIRVDRISGEDGDRDKIERVRVNATKGERDHYGNKLAK